MNDILLPKRVGGYSTFTTGELWLLCNSVAKKELAFSSLKIYLACKEMVERRCKTKKSAQYGAGEIEKLTGLSSRSIKIGLKQLANRKLLLFSEDVIAFYPIELSEKCPFDTNPNRLVPIPRRLLRVLSRHHSKGQIIVTLVHCARGLFLLQGQLVMKGAVKSSWIQKALNIGRTTINSTRAWLRKIGFLKAQQGIAQWRLNRFGYYFEILCGQFPKRKKRETSKNTEIDTPYKITPFNKLKLNTSNRRLTSNSKGYKSGFFKRKFNSEPDIRDIQREDLKQISSLLTLFKQATLRGWLVDSEHSFQNFVGAAVRATNLGTNPPALFVGLVKNKSFWKYITHAEEERAVSAIKRYREKYLEKDSCRSKNTQAEKGKVLDLVKNLIPEVPKAYFVEL